MTGFNRRRALGLLAAAPVAAMARPAAAMRLAVNDRLPRFDLLTPGSRSYRTSVLKSGHPVVENIRRREIAFESGGLVRIRQYRDGVGGADSAIEHDSSFQLGSFRPSFRTTRSGGRQSVEGFQSDDVGTGFSVRGAEPGFNLEAELELLQTLPWARGYAVSIPFLHPRSDNVPARYLWWVAGEESLAWPGSRAIDCWVAACDYNTDQPPTRAWLSKRTQQVVKVEGQAPDGTVHRKMLMS